MNVFITKLRLGASADKAAAQIMHEGSSETRRVCDAYVEQIRKKMDIASYTPLLVVMNDGMPVAYWEEFGAYFKANRQGHGQAITPPRTQLKLYDVYIGPSAMGSHRLVMLSESEESGIATLRNKFPELSSDVKVELTEVEGPFHSGFIICKVDNSGRQEFNGIYREARD